VIGLLIIAHGTLGESLIHCASHVMGERPPLLEQIGISVNDDPVTLLPQAQQTVAKLDQGDGVLVLSDMYGATPCNLVGKLLVPGRIEGIAGVNLPMLVRALAYRNEPLEVLIEKAVAGGCGGVIHFTHEACLNHG
jgi:PTS system mannose-specific IIA component